MVDICHAYNKGRKIFSNIWLGIPHTPIKTVYDFIDIAEGDLLADELWHLANSRKTFSLLNDVINIILLRSRKKGFNVRFTQQHFLQVDLRIRYITDEWIRPRFYQKEGILRQDIYDPDGNHKGTRFINAKPFFKFYNTKKDPYTLETMITEQTLRETLSKALKAT